MWTLTSSGYTRTWHSAGTVSVPAGSFDDCWRVDQVGTNNDNSTFTYCRGVGLVAEHTDDGSGNGADVVLTSKSF
jgi:hypothetical protein